MGGPMDIDSEEDDKVENVELVTFQDDLLVVHFNESSHLQNMTVSSLAGRNDVAGLREALQAGADPNFPDDV